MNLTTHKKILIGLIGWITLVFFSIFEYHSLFGKSCNFFESWLSCSTQPSLLSKELILFFVLVIFGSFIAGGWYLWKFYMSDNHINNNKSYLIIILFFLLSIFIVPFASRDITFYFSSGKALHSGLNTYAQSWHISNYFVEAVQGSQDLVGFPYGPVMASVFKVVYSISGDNMVIFTIFWRLFIISLFILLSFLTYFLIRHYSKSHNKEIFYLFFLTQPLFLFEIVGNVLFDVFWIIFVLLAIIFAQYKKRRLVVSSLFI